jgi:hypothetical protein
MLERVDRTAAGVDLVGDGALDDRTDEPVHPARDGRDELRDRGVAIGVRIRRGDVDGSLRLVEGEDVQGVSHERSPPGGPSAGPPRHPRRP